MLLSVKKESIDWTDSFIISLYKGRRKWRRKLKRFKTDRHVLKAVEWVIEKSTSDCWNSAWALLYELVRRIHIHFETITGEMPWKTFVLEALSCEFGTWCLLGLLYADDLGLIWRTLNLWRRSKGSSLVGVQL